MNQHVWIELALSTSGVQRATRVDMIDGQGVQPLFYTPRVCHP